MTKERNLGHFRDRSELRGCVVDVLTRTGQWWWTKGAKRGVFEVVRRNGDGSLGLEEVLCVTDQAMLCMCYCSKEWDLGEADVNVVTLEAWLCVVDLGSAAWHLFEEKVL